MDRRGIWQRIVDEVIMPPVPPFPSRRQHADEHVDLGRRKQFVVLAPRGGVHVDPRGVIPEADIVLGAVCEATATARAWSWSNYSGGRVCPARSR